MLVRSAMPVRSTISAGVSILPTCKNAGDQCICTLYMYMLCILGNNDIQ